MKKKKWTKEDNEKLAKVILVDKSVGLTFKEAFEDASGVLERSVYACEKQWRKIKHKYEDELKKYQNVKIKVSNKIKTTKKPEPSNLSTTNISKIKPLNDTKLEYLVNSIELAKKEDLQILNSGKGEREFVVVNNEGDSGYLVSTYENKVVSCNCPHRQFRDAICKHMVKVALEKKLEVF